jgi:cytoskeleton protein RodZ
MLDPDETSRTDSAADEPTVGEILRTARLERDVSLGDVAAELRMEPRLLESLEADQFSGLGPPVFVKGYIRQYGRQLGLDYEDLLAAYNRQVQVEEVSIRPNTPIQLRDERLVRIWIVTGLVLMTLAIFLLVWWLGIEDDPLAGLSPFDAAPPDAGAPSPGPAITLPAIEGRNGAADETESSQSSSSAVDRGEVTQPAEREAVTLDEVEALPEEPGDAAALELNEAPASTPPILDAGLTALRVRFEEDCWTEITDSRGNRLYYDLAEAGTETVLYGELPINVFFGNADAVELTVNGASYQIPARSRRGNLANFIIYPPAN